MGNTTARPKSMDAAAVRPQLRGLALEALRRYQRDGLCQAGDKMFWVVARRVIEMKP